MIRVLLTGIGGTAARNFAKSLRMAQDDHIHITGIDYTNWHHPLAPIDKFYTFNHCKSTDYIPRLIHLLNKEHIDVLIPQPDVEVRVISECRERILSETKTKLFLPDKPVIRACQSKYTTHLLLHTANVPTPKTVLINGYLTERDILNVHPDKTAYIPNASKAWLRADNAAGSRASLPITDPVLANAWINYWRNKDSDLSFILCEYLPGREYAFQSLWYKGELITSAARERLQYLFGNLTPSGQSSTPSVAKTVHDDRINDIAARAIRAVDPKPHGIYCVDLKENHENIPNVTEINAGRFFTTNDFFAKLGQNMPKMYVTLAYSNENPYSPTLTPQFNAVQPNVYYLRGVDTEPKILTEPELIKDNFYKGYTHEQAT